MSEKFIFGLLVIAVIFACQIYTNFEWNLRFGDANNLNFFTPTTSKPDYDIYFIESDPNRDELSARQMCAIESAARHNPKATVKVVTFKARLDAAATSLLDEYKNIQIVDFDPDTMINDLSHRFFAKGEEIPISEYSVAHMSDFLR